MFVSNMSLPLSKFDEFYRGFVQISFFHFRFEEFLCFGKFVRILCFHFYFANEVMLKVGKAKLHVIAALFKSFVFNFVLRPSLYDSTKI